MTRFLALLILVFPPLYIGVAAAAGYYHFEETHYATNRRQEKSPSVVSVSLWPNRLAPRRIKAAVPQELEHSEGIAVAPATGLVEYPDCLLSAEPA